ncbi:MAG: hypothetical protein JXR03_06515 [Cyclobacteriaceae bacterium]
MGLRKAVLKLFSLINKRDISTPYDDRHETNRCDIENFDPNEYEVLSTSDEGFKILHYRSGVLDFDNSGNRLVPPEPFDGAPVGGHGVASEETVPEGFERIKSGVYYKSGRPFQGSIEMIQPHKPN